MTDKELKHEAIGLGLDASCSLISYFKMSELIGHLEEKIYAAYKHILRMKSENANIINPVYKRLLDRVEWKKWKVRNELANITRRKTNVWGKEYRSLKDKEAYYKLKYIIANYFEGLRADLDLHQYSPKTIEIIQLGVEAEELVDMIKGWLVV